MITLTVYHERKKNNRPLPLTNINIYINISIKENVMSKIKSIGMAEARPKLTQLVDEVSNGSEPYLIVSGSKVKAVLIGIDAYNDMVERLEDLSDAAELMQAELQQEQTMPFEEHLKKSKETKHGVPVRS
jgi:prevent-host-death family protein